MFTNIILVIVTLTTPGSEYLILDPGPTSAFFGIMDKGPSLLFTNPASIAMSGIDLYHTEWFKSIRYDNASYSTKLGRAFLSFGINGVYTFGIERRTGPTPEPEGKFGAYFINPAVGYQIPIKLFSVGLTSKLIYERIDNYKGYGGAIDLGSRYDLKRFSFALTFSNLGIGAKLKDERSPLPLSVRAGIGYKPINQLNLVVEVSKVLQYYSPDLRLGISVSPFKFLTINGGYYQKRLLFGATVTPGKIGVAYSFKPLGLGYCHSFGVQFRPQPKKEIPRFLAQAIDAYQKGRWDEAINALDIDLIWNPDDQKARILMTKAQQKKKERRIDSLNQIGVWSMGKGDYLEAISIFGQILEIAPDNSTAIENKTRAVSLFLTETKVKTEVADRIKQAMTYYSRRDYNNALKLLKDALVLDPKNRDVLNYIDEINTKKESQIQDIAKQAERHLHQGKYRPALSLVDQGLKIEPTSVLLISLKQKIITSIKAAENSLLKEAITYYEKGEKEGASAKFWQVLAINPNNKTARAYLSRLETKGDPEKYYLLGVEAYTKGKFDLAIQYWQKVLEIKPDHKWAKTNIERAAKKLRTLSE